VGSTPGVLRCRLRCLPMRPDIPACTAALAAACTNKESRKGIPAPPGCQFAGGFSGGDRGGPRSCIFLHASPCSLQAHAAHPGPPDRPDGPRRPEGEATAQASPPPSATNLFQEGAGCPQGQVSRIFIDNHSVFDPASLPDDSRIRWAYRLANRIHVRTRPDFIEAELLLSVGDCYDPGLTRESARILREFRFVASADVFSVPQEDGSRHLVVETRDEWTTKFAGDITFDGGMKLRGVSLMEENFLGRGISLGAYFVDVDERREVGGRFEIPRLRGSNWDLSTSAGRTRVGTTWSQAVLHPFVGEVGTFAFRQRGSSRRDLFTWNLPMGPPWTQLVAPLEVGSLEVTGARRFGTSGRFFLVGGGISREWVRPGGTALVEGVIAGAFDDRRQVPDSVALPLRSQLETREATRLNVLLGVRRVAYVERRGLDALTGVQDVPVGREALLSVGPAVGGSGPMDVFVRGDLFGGVSSGPWVGQLYLSLEGRQEAAGPPKPRRAGDRGCRRPGYPWRGARLPVPPAPHPPPPDAGAQDLGPGGVEHPGPLPADARWARRGARVRRDPVSRGAKGGRHGRASASPPLSVSGPGRPGRDPLHRCRTNRSRGCAVGGAFGVAGHPGRWASDRLPGRKRLGGSIGRGPSPGGRRDGRPPDHPAGPGMGGDSRHLPERVSRAVTTERSLLPLSRGEPGPFEPMKAEGRAAIGTAKEGGEANL
jgi:hypothetical protein